eukprot:scaffold51929_cov31-Tisochrysis_lutea.AAC.2
MAGSELRALLDLEGGRQEKIGRRASPPCCPRVYLVGLATPKRLVDWASRSAHAPIFAYRIVVFPPLRRKSKSSA